jgi:hypothetical protein
VQVYLDGCDSACVAVADGAGASAQCHMPVRHMEGQEAIAAHYKCTSPFLPFLDFSGIQSINSGRLIWCFIFRFEVCKCVKGTNLLRVICRYNRSSPYYQCRCCPYY